MPSRVAIATAAVLACLAPPASASTIPVATGNAARALFATDEPLLPSLDHDSAMDIYQRAGGALTLETIGDPSCRPGCGNANVDVDVSKGLHPVGSDGVIFSTAESLVPADTDNSVDIYRRSGETLELVSQGPNGFNGPYDAEFWSSNDAGTKVVFATTERLVGADTDSSTDIYERDGGTTTLVSQGPQGFNGPFDAVPAANAADESAVFFLTAEPLVGADTDSSVDLYERAGGTTTLVSQGPQGFNGPFDVEGPIDVAEDGSRVAFATAERLVEQDTDEQPDIYLRSGNTTVLASLNTYDPLEGEYPTRLDALHPRAETVIFSTGLSATEEDRDKGAVDIFERSYGETKMDSQGPFEPYLQPAFDAEFLALSPESNAVFFSTSEPMVREDTDSSPDVYERAGTTTRLVSQGPNGFNGPLGATFWAVSPDGSRVLFTTAERLVGADTDSSVDLYERAGGATTLVSRGQINGNGAFDVTPHGDFGALLFTTSEQLVPGDTDSQPDLYERSEGHTRLVSTAVPDPAAPLLNASDPPSPANSASPAISGEAEADSAVALYADPGCAGTPLASGGSAEFASPGLTVSVPENATTEIFGQTTNGYGYAGPCSGPFEYLEDSSTATPSLTGIDPSGPANQNSPLVRGTAEAGATVRVYTDPSCTGSPAATGTEAELAGTGIATPVPDDSRTSFFAIAVDRAGNVSACSSPSPQYVEDSTPPQTTIEAGPRSRTRDRTPAFRLGADEPATFRCQVDARPARACRSSFTASPALSSGAHRVAFTAIDAAGNADPTPAVRRFRVLPRRGRRSH